MECLAPIKIYNPRKFFSLDYDDLYSFYVRCGKCINCQDINQKEWYFRAYFEYLDCISKGGYMLMDCLSYDEKHCPRVSRFIPDLPAKFNFRCFDYTDVRLFLVRLRTYLTRQGYDVKNSLRYFFSSEYGTSESYVDERGRVRKSTHRPHYHILFYCTNPKLDNLTLSRAISSCWSNGRTDGLPFKSRRYVDDMTIKGGVASAVRSCKYVSKYVMKSSEFEIKAEKRLNRILFYIYQNRFSYFRAKTFRFEPQNYDSHLVDSAEYFTDWDSFYQFQQSECAKKIRRDYKRAFSQFHKQSLGFGASYLNSCDIDSIIENNIIAIPDGKTIVNRIGLPTYYKRKLFYELVEPLENCKMWQPTALGRKYLEKRKLDRIKALRDEYNCARTNYGLNFDIDKLSNYVINKRGRIRANNSTFFIDDILKSSSILYNYVTASDKKHFHLKFLTDKYNGNSKGYVEKGLPQKMVNPLVFENEYVCYNPELEQQLTSLSIAKFNSLSSEAKVKINKQRLNQLYKTIFQ